jgi:hypothetical protein
VPNSAIKPLERLTFYCDFTLLSTPQSTRPVADSMSVELTTLTRITRSQSAVMPPNSILCYGVRWQFGWQKII